jgi:opacity protein-like surface antigen
VVGFEADLTQPNQKKITSTLVTGGLYDGQPNATHEYKVPWLITSRAVAGLTFDNFLIYGTGGLAFANEEILRTQYKGNTPPYTDPMFTETDSKNHIGYALGLGAEWKFNKKWALRAEYLDIRFPEATFRFPDARGGAGGGFNTVQGRVARNTMQIETSRIGLAYSFY